MKSIKNRVAQIDQITNAITRAMSRLDPAAERAAGQLDIEDSIAFHQLLDARDELRELRARFACCAENAID